MTDSTRLPGPEGQNPEEGGARQNETSWDRLKAAEQSFADYAGPETTPRRRGPRIGRVGFLVAVLVLLWTGLAVVWQWHRASDELAPGLLGVWTTVDSRYADRALRLTDSTVSLSQGPGTTVTYPIQRVRRSSMGEEVRYEVWYRDPGGVIALVLYWDPLAGAVRLENPVSVIWYRSAPARPVSSPGG